jgi:mono/diheme cytochrome c family protein
MRRTLALAMFAVVLGDQSAQAQDSFEARQGRAFAQHVCSGCHGVVPGAASAVAGAPNFYAIANTPGMSPLALRVALQTPHRSMPNLMLTTDELRDVTAYIMSLRSN